MAPACIGFLALFALTMIFQYQLLPAAFPGGLSLAALRGRHPFCSCKSTCRFILSWFTSFCRVPRVLGRHRHLAATWLLRSQVQHVGVRQLCVQLVSLHYFTVSSVSTIYASAYIEPSNLTPSTNSDASPESTMLAAPTVTGSPVLPFSKAPS